MIMKKNTVLCNWNKIIILCKLNIYGKDSENIL